MANYFSIVTADRNLRWLAGLILVQVLLIFIVFWPSDTRTKGDLLFVDRTAVDITELKLVEVEGEYINLSKRGNDWAMSDADDFFVKCKENKLTEKNVCFTFDDAIKSIEYFLSLMVANEDVIIFNAGKNIL